MRSSGELLQGGDIEAGTMNELGLYPALLVTSDLCHFSLSWLPQAPLPESPGSLVKCPRVVAYGQECLGTRNGRMIKTLEPEELVPMGLPSV